MADCGEAEANKTGCSHFMGPFLSYLATPEGFILSSVRVGPYLLFVLHMMLKEKSR